MIVDTDCACIVGFTFEEHSEKTPILVKLAMTMSVCCVLVLTIMSSVLFVQYLLRVGVG